MLTLVKRGEPAPGPAGFTAVDENTVIATGSTKRSKHADIRYYADGVTFDFTGVTREELVELATYPMWIKVYQVHFRECKGNEREQNKVADTVYKVRAILDAPKTRATGPRDPVKSATNALAKLSDAEFKTATGFDRPNASLEEITGVSRPTTDNS